MDAPPGTSPFSYALMSAMGSWVHPETEETSGEMNEMRKMESEFM